VVARPRSDAPGELVDLFGRSDVGATLVVALLPADDQEPGEGPGMTAPYQSGQGHTVTQTGRPQGSAPTAAMLQDAACAR
jgi:hypothetical protein